MKDVTNPKVKPAKMTPKKIKQMFVDDFGGCSLCGNTNIKKVQIKGHFVICKECNQKFSMQNFI